MSTDDLLGPLRRAGDVDSEGALTIDHARAAEKLGTFQHAEPSELVLDLVQSAVAAGARTVSIDPGWISFSHDGTPPTDAQLEDIQMAVLTDPKTRHGRAVQALGAAANTALLRAGSVQIVCWRNGRGTQADVGQSGVRLTTPAAANGGWTTRVVARGTSITSADIQRQLTRCRFAPIPIYCDRKLINADQLGGPGRIPFWKPVTRGIAVPALGMAKRYYHLGHHVIELRWLCEDDDDPRMSIGYPSNATHCIERLWDEPLWPVHLQTRAHAAAHPRNASRRFWDVPRHSRHAAYRCVIGLQADLQARTEVFFVRDGVVLDEPRDIPLVSGFRAVIAVDHLHTDMSRLRIVDDGPYARVREDLSNRMNAVHGILQDMFAGSVPFALNREPLS